MDQFEVMGELYSDRSNWVDVRHYPSTVICRRMLRLADFAAADPARWGSCRLAFEVPELSRPELAVEPFRRRSEARIKLVKLLPAHPHQMRRFAENKTPRRTVKPGARL